MIWLLSLRTVFLLLLAAAAGAVLWAAVTGRE
jgi:hypothetical protein